MYIHIKCVCVYFFYEEVIQRLKCFFKSCHLKHIAPYKNIKYIHGGIVNQKPPSMLQTI